MNVRHFRLSAWLQLWGAMTAILSIVLRDEVTAYAAFVVVSLVQAVVYL